jgi:hypothetical protein
MRWPNSIASSAESAPTNRRARVRLELDALHLSQAHTKKLGALLTRMLPDASTIPSTPISLMPNDFTEPMSASTWPLGIVTENASSVPLSRSALRRD